MKFKKEYKKLYKAYAKALKKLYKYELQTGQSPMEYFVMYLRYMRDIYTLTEGLGTKENPNTKLVSIDMAINAYTQYMTCINKYYINNNGVLQRRSLELTPEQVTEQYNKERHTYWMNFWSLVATYMEGWVIDNASA